MVKCTSVASLETSGPFRLRWSEQKGGSLREELVDILEEHVPQWIIRSAREVNANTPVHLTGENYSGDGIVQSCKQENFGFVITIFMNENEAFAESKAGRDPGVFAIEEFLTEEEEAKILEGQGPHSGQSYGPVWRVYYLRDPSGIEPWCLVLVNLYSRSVCSSETLCLIARKL